MGINDSAPPSLLSHFGGSGADKFKCGSGDDVVTDFNEAEGDKATGGCEAIEKGNSKTK